MKCSVNNRKCRVAYIRYSYLIAFCSKCIVNSSSLQGGHQPGKPGEDREFDSSQRKVTESGKKVTEIVLSVVCYYTVAIFAE